jgi:formylglycine-generating enzyme required for sulfatase activity
MIDPLVATLFRDTISIPGLSARASRHLLTNSNFVVIANSVKLINQEQYTYEYLNTFNKDNPLRFREDHTWSVDAGYEDHPVVGLTYNGASAIAQAIGARLALELEWVAAARIGQGHEVDYAWGMEPPTPNCANFGHHHDGPTPVGLFAPSPGGLYDLCGNAEEWVTCPTLQNDLVAAVKGGGWNKAAEWMRISETRHRIAFLGSMSTGVRLFWDER